MTPAPVPAAQKPASAPSTPAQSVRVPKAVKIAVGATLSLILGIAFLTIIGLTILGGQMQSEIQAANNSIPSQVATTTQSAPSVVPGSSNCGAMKTDECDWVNKATSLLGKSINVEKRQGESSAVWSAKMSASVDQSLADFSQLEPPERCIRASTLVSHALSQAKSLAVYGASGTEFITKEGAQQFDDVYNKKREDVASLYGECAAEFQKLGNSPQ